MQIQKILTHPLFLVGIVIRCVAIAFGDTLPLEQWYAPFLQAGVSGLNFDPWSLWMAQEGSSIVAFPYGLAMWLVFLPLSLVCSIFGLSIHVAYFLSLAACDFIILVTLQRLTNCTSKIILLLYWLSPITIVGTYYLSLNDLVPAMFLVLAILQLKRQRFFTCGCFFAAAVSAKLSMLIALPFLAIYLYHNKSLRYVLGYFLVGVLSAALLLFLPVALSPSGTNMVFSTPGAYKLFQLYIPLGDTTSIYVIPLVYILMVYALWRIRRPNFELLTTMLGVAFLGFVLLTAGLPGWFIWSIPFLVYYQIQSGRLAKFFTFIFSITYAATYLSPPILSHFFRLNFPNHQVNVDFLLQTLVFAIGLILLIRICRESIYKNDYFRSSKTPFAMGIAGDSGAGKDTFVNALEEVFGAHSIARISGDDYHRWDRHKPMWTVMTHLNPAANDLERFAEHLMRLVDGKYINSSHYDHATGKMSKPRKIVSNDFILASGLHALLMPTLRRCYDLSVYLDMDEGLRRYLKFRRDVAERGHTPDKVRQDIERREIDSEKFIRVQCQFADLVFSVQPDADILQNYTELDKIPRLKLRVSSRIDYNVQSLSRVLSGVFGLHVDSLSNPQFESVVCVDGDMGAEDVAMAAAILCPSIFDFIDIYPRWNDGMLGIMQLVTLMHISQCFKRRIIK